MRQVGSVNIKLMRIGIALAVALVAGACSNQPPDDRDYPTRVAALRQAKDLLFQRSSTPIPENRKAEFLPLKYYPIDAAYNVAAVLKPSTDTTIFMMPTSTGQPREERRAGTLEFTLNGQQMTLLAFVEASAPNVDRLFVPFADMTSGTETYAGGRFMDLDRTATDLYELDFNRAYIPYCYYNAAFECPYPPAENRLKVPIRAGEKVAEGDNF